MVLRRPPLKIFRGGRRETRYSYNIIIYDQVYDGNVYIVEQLF